MSILKDEDTAQNIYKDSFIKFICTVKTQFRNFNIGT